MSDPRSRLPWAPTPDAVQELLGGPHVWLMALDRAGRALLWSEGAERLSGWPASDVVGGDAFWERLFPDPRYSGFVRDGCLCSPGACGLEVAICRRDGSACVLQWHVFPPADGADGVRLVVGHERRDRATVVRTIEHPERFFEKFLAGLSVGVFQVRRQGARLDKAANPTLARMLGFGSTQELLDFDHDLLVPASERARVEELLNLHGSVRDSEVDLVRRDGTVLQASINARVLRDADGRLQMVTGTVEDTAERRAAQQALKASKEKYRQLVEGVGEPILTVDEHGVCLAMNQVAARYAGGDASTFEGRPLRDIFPLDAANAFLRIARSVIDTARPQRHELQVMLQGKETWLQMRACPVRGVGGEARVQILALDITDRKSAEGEVLLYQQRLRALASRLSDTEERERRRLAADLHANISQSLALAIMNLGVLRGSATRPREADGLRTIQDLVEQALLAARTLTCELSPPVLSELGFEEALEWLAEITGERYALAVRVEHDGLPLVISEHARTVLFKAVQELLTNVGRHAAAREAVVAVRADASDVVVSVSDDGCGMREGSDAARPARGGGFGLFNVREQIRQLGGAVRVRSRPGEGTCILLTLPLRDAEADGQGAPA
ncbi:MAG: PAS domain S-box protein [Candidatus Brocadiaceae bacterium]|nr:PAS domain S-box protein [Candidatus Brocadiaceae bacterium]